MTLSPLHDVKKTRLKNGLTVLYEINPAAPVVAMAVGIKIGSAWETKEEAGLSHVLEHMVFKGSTTFKAGEMASVVEGCGGDFNAYTSFDRTLYYINLPARFLKQGMQVLNEMVFEATIDATELEREKEVILEELRRYQDNPEASLGELLFRTAYTTHPYGRPIIGYESTIRAFTRDTVYGFYKRWYTPSNMVLAVSGDFKEQDLLDVIHSWDDKPDLPVTHPDLPAEPTPTKPKNVLLSREVQGHYMAISFPATPFQHPDTPALDMLGHLLGGADTSPLEQVLKEKLHLANQVHASAFTPLFPGVFTIDAHLPAHTVDDFLPALHTQVELTKEKLFDAHDLERAKTGMLSSVYYEKQTCEGTVKKWIVYEMSAGDHRFEEEYLRAIQALSNDDIRRVARKYLDWNQSVIALLHPQKSKKKFKLSPPVIKQKKVTHKLSSTVGPIRKFTLANGLRIVTRENHRLPIMSVHAAALGGIRFENKRTNGLGQLMTRVIEKGTSTKDALQVARIEEEIAGHVSAFHGKNSWGLSASCLSSQWEKGLDLLTDLLLHPAMKQDEIDRERKFMLESIKNEQDSLAHLAYKKFQQLLFPQHPYGLSQLGTPENLKSFTRTKLVRHHQDLLNARNMVITATGDFDSEQLVSFLSDRLGGLKSEAKRFAKPAPQKAPRNVQVANTIKNKLQSHLVIGFLANTLHSPERYAMDVMNNVLSGQSGRLFLDLRDTRSLAYTVSSSVIEGLEPGFFSVYMGTEPSKLKEAFEGIMRHLQALLDEDVPPAELERSKNYVIGSYESDLQKNSTVATSIGFNELYGFPMEEFEDYPKKIEDVTAADIRAAARKHIRLDRYVLSVVGSKAFKP